MLSEIFMRTSSSLRLGKERNPSHQMLAHVGVLRYWENRKKYYRRKERLQKIENVLCLVLSV
jgi:hypothetical protein